jgi:hypothetical protein
MLRLRSKMFILSLHVFHLLCALPCYRSRDRDLMRWIFSVTCSFQPHCGPGVDNRNEYQESSRGGGGKGRPVRKADNLTAICEQIV